MNYLLIDNFPPLYREQYTELNCQVSRKVKYCLQIATVCNTTC